jgi:hypothetical protein
LQSISIPQFNEKDETLIAIADKLNSMGVKTRRCYKWYVQSTNIFDKHNDYEILK